MSTEKENVTITIIAREEADGRIFLDQYDYKGYRYIKKGKPFIVYEEPLEEGETVSSVIRIDEDKVAILRNEKAGGHMVFDPSHRYRTRYQTPFGEMEYYVTTRGLTREEQEKDTRIFVEYSLQMIFSNNDEPDPESQDLSRNMEIRISPITQQ